MKGRDRQDAGSAPAGDRTALTAPTRQERLGTIRGWLHPKMAPFGQAEQVNIEEVVGQNGGQADGNPQQGEGQANLPQKISRHSAVVPDLVAPVDQQSGCQLYGGNDSGAYEHAPSDGQGLRHLTQVTDEQKTDASCHKHTPMAPAPPEQLHAGVNHAAQVPEDSVSPQSQGKYLLIVL